MKDGVHSWWHIAGGEMVLIIMGYYFMQIKPVCWVIWFVGNMIGFVLRRKTTHPPCFRFIG